MPRRPPSALWLSILLKYYEQKELNFLILIKVKEPLSTKNNRFVILFFNKLLIWSSPSSRLHKNSFNKIHEYV